MCHFEMRSSATIEKSNCHLERSEESNARNGLTHLSTAGRNFTNSFSCRQHGLSTALDLTIFMIPLSTANKKSLPNGKPFIGEHPSMLQPDSSPWDRNPTQQDKDMVIFPEKTTVDFVCIIFWIISIL